MTGIIGKKIGMTRMYDDNNRCIPCTVIEGGSYRVTQIKTTSKDGYDAIQVGYGSKKEKNTTKPEMGHLKKSKSGPFRILREFRDFQEEYEKEISVGSEFTISDVLSEGDYVDAVGTSKGKGFQGVVKRHGFSGVGDRTHGQHNRNRAPGSIGGASYPSRVFKGLRMAGRTGGSRVKVQNLQILKIFPEKNLVVVNGAVPGGKNSYIILEK